ncbi:MAG: hypothetical protein ABR598_07690 [Candidatus Dormibacteria bacterium]
MSTERGIDFEDSSTVTWALTDDPVNQRIQVQAIAVGAAAATLAAMSDVDLTGLANGQQLHWDAAAGKWKPGAGGTSITWRGAYNAATAYAINDVVSSGGSSYISTAAQTNVPPPGATWGLVAQKGADGAAGTNGTNGTNGAAGQGVPAGGTAGQVLAKIDGTDYNDHWVDQTAGGGGMANPMTTAADLIVGGAAGAPARLAKGADGQVLTVDPTTHLLVWATPAAGGGGSAGGVAPLRQAVVDRVAAQTIPNNTDTEIKADTIDTDPDGAYSLSTGRYTCPVAGSYLVTGFIKWVATPGGNVTNSIYKNGVLLSRPMWVNPNSNVEAWPFSQVIVCAAGDTLSFGAYQASNSPADVTGRCAFVLLASSTTLLTGGGGDQVWIAPTLAGAWAVYAGNAPGYRIDALGFVHLRGMLQGGSGTMFTLPVAYRPAQATQHDAAQGGGTYRVQVNADGTVVPIDAPATYGSLDGISFYVGPATAVGLSSDNEGQASILINATSPGDAGNRSDHFLGGALAAAWVNEATAFAVSQVGKSSLALKTAAGNGHLLRPYTPSGAFRVEARVMSPGGANAIGFFMRDAATGDAAGDGVLVQVDGGGLNLYSFDGGAFTSRQTLAVGGIPQNTWYYLALVRDGANNWHAEASFDRNFWFATGAYAKAFAVAKMGFRAGASVAAYDFVDVVS